MVDDTARIAAGRRTRPIAGALVALALAAAVSLLGPAAASANLELVKSFDNGAVSEGGKLSGGGVDLAQNEHTGDLYLVDPFADRLLRFNEHGELLEGWGWGVGDGKEESERCGPDGEPAYPECLGRSAEGIGERGWSGEGPGEFDFDSGVAVDQATGDVYVVSQDVEAGDVVQVFSASGELITSFAHKGPGESEVERAGPIAVDSAGDVYIASSRGPRGPRLLEYVKKSATEYVFSRELLRGLEEVEFLDAAANGSLFVASFTEIFRFDASNFTTAAWEHSLISATAVTINPETGEVLYYGRANKFHEFKPRGRTEVENGAGEAGKEELFEGQANEENAASAAYDPAGEETGHGRGIFYAAVEFNTTTRELPHMLLFAPPGVLPPVVEAENVASAGTTSAGLSAVLNDKHFAGQYQFEYGPAPCSGGGCAAAAPVGLAPVNGPQPVSTTLSGLAPGTTYHYRVTLTTHCNPGEPAKECVVHGADETFTTFANPSPALPDGRVYELVTPPEKDGGEAFPLDPGISSCGCEPGGTNPRQPAESTADGSAVAYEGYPFASSGDAVDENEYRSERTPSGWETVDLTPALETSHERGYLALSGSLEEGVLSEFNASLAPGAPPDTDELYLRGADGSLQPLLSDGSIDFAALENPLRVEYGGAASTFGTVVFAANDPLTAEVPGLAPAAPKVSANEDDLYSWTGGRLRLVNVLPSRHALAGAVIGAGSELAVTTESAPDHSNAVSADGTRIFWSNPATGQAYVRIAGTTTLKIPDTAPFLTASASGEVVLLSDGRMFLIGEGGATPIADLSAGQGGFLGILGASRTLAQVYFVDTAKLTSEEGPAHTSAQPGADNLYAYSDGETRFVATLEADDDKVGLEGVTGDWQASPSDRLAQVTPDGSYLAFMSRAPLTGYDNHAENGACGESPAHACFEVFEYGLAERTLVCASCSRASIPPVGESRLSLMHPIGSRAPQPRNLTNGGRLFFDSFDVLTLEDQHPGVENVYEYERGGEGSCESAEGCVSLISSGRGSSDSSFLSAGETGADVFFTTREALVPEDEDELVDVYDAREGGGFARSGAPAPCHGEACMPLTVPATSSPAATMQTLPPEASARPGSPAAPRLDALLAKVKDGRLLLTVTPSADAVVRVTGAFTEAKTVAVGAGHRQALAVGFTRSGLRLLRRGRTIGFTVIVQMGDSRIVRRLEVRR